MKKFSTFLVILCASMCINLNATTHSINSTGDLSYSPSALEANIGDTVVFTITSSHPTAQVSEETWNANEATELPGGFGTMTSSFTIILEAIDAPTLYYVCVNHIGAGMKGLITISPDGIGELINDANFEYGPNPLTNRQLNYQMSVEDFNSATLNVFSIDGKLVSSMVLTEQNGSIPMTLSAGKYFIQILNDEQELLVVDRLIVL